MSDQFIEAPAASAQISPKKATIAPRAKPSNPEASYVVLAAAVKKLRLNGSSVQDIKNNIGAKFNLVKKPSSFIRKYHEKTLGFREASNMANF